MKRKLPRVYTLFHSEFNQKNTYTLVQRSTYLVPLHGLATLIVMVFFWGVALSQTLGIYEFTGASTADNQFNAVSAQPAGATFSTFTRTGVNWVTGNNVFNSNNFDATQNNSKYLTFTITPANKMALTEISWDMARGGNSGTWAIRSSIDGYAANIATGTIANGTNPYTVIFPSGFQNLTASVTFRIYVYNLQNTASSRTVTIDNVRLSGITCPSGDCLIYCPSNSSSSLYGYINNFATSGGLTNITNNGSGFSSGGYGDFTSMSVGQTAGSSVSFSCSFNSGTFGVAVWIDWNRNGVFEGAERVFNTTSYVGSVASSFTIPVGQASGNYRLRVLADYLTVNPANPCSTFSYGEVEDYTVNVVAITPCSGLPTAGTVLASPEVVCPNFSSVLALNGSTVASGLEYQWEQSVDGISGWVNAVGGSGADNPNYTTPGLTSARYYRCVLTCTSSGQSSISSVTMVDVVGASGIYRTVSSTNGQLLWNNSSTWECGLIPPVNGTAEVIIQSPPTVNLNANFVTLPTSAIDVKSVTLNTGASLKMGTANVTHVCRQQFNIANGAQFGAGNWTGGGIQSLSIGGDIVNNGTFGQGFSNGGYDYVIILNGTSAQSFSGSGASTFIGGKTAGVSQLIIANTSAEGVTLGVNFGANNGSGVAGKVIINDGAMLRFSSPSIQIVNGNTNQLELIGTTELKAGTFNAHFAMLGTRTINTATSRIIYTNASSNLTPTSNIPWSVLGSITSNMGAAGLLTVGGATTLQGELAMVNGDIATTTTNLLTIGISNTSPGTVNWQDGTVLGPLRRWFVNSANTGDLSGIFPVGNVLSGNTLNRWIRIEHSTAPSTAGYLTVQFVPINPITTSAGSNGLSLIDQGIVLDNIATEGYWEATKGALQGGLYTLTARVNSFTSVQNFTQSRIIKSPGPLHSLWQLDGTHNSLIGTVPDYTLSRTGMSDFSYFAVGYPSVPLPVELISFKAVCSNDGVELFWSTATEKNSDYFEFERSIDGLKWEKIGQVSAAGNSSLQIDYVFQDNQTLRNEVLYYRMRQYDLDGAFELFNPISADCPKSEGDILIWPNPANDLITISSPLETQNSIVEVRILDAFGRVVNRQSKTSAELALFSIDISQFETGVYILQIDGVDFVSREGRFVKM
jgi:hypothetical protein